MARKMGGGQSRSYASNSMGASGGTGPGAAAYEDGGYGGNDSKPAPAKSGAMEKRSMPPTGPGSASFKGDEKSAIKRRTISTPKL
jgi:hypothetical protein